MILSKEQLNDYNTKGFIVLENMLSIKEVTNLKSKILTFQSCKSLPNIICDDNGEIRSVFMPNKHEDIFRSLYLDKRLVEPCSMIIDEEIYLYQYKLNLKKPFLGQFWEWHQDFAYWNLDDGVQSPDLVSAMIYLDDTKSYQGPLMVIPESHKFDVVAFKEKNLQHQGELMGAIGADLKYTINEQMIKELADKSGIEVLELSAGSCIFFHPNLFHASNGNLSPYDRDTVIITYNSVKNIPQTKNLRPDFICSRDYTPIQVLA